MTTPEFKVADAIRDVTVAIQKSIAEGHRSRMIDANDLIDVLLSIADRLDPPLSDMPNNGTIFDSTEGSR